MTEALVDAKKDLDLVMKRPSILDDLEEELYHEFYNHDSEYTDHLKNALRRLGYKDFCRLYRGQYSITTRTDDDIKKKQDQTQTVLQTTSGEESIRRSERSRIIAMFMSAVTLSMACSSVKRASVLLKPLKQVAIIFKDCI